MTERELTKGNPTQKRIRPKEPDRERERNPTWTGKWEKESNERKTHQEPDRERERINQERKLSRTEQREGENKSTERVTHQEPDRERMNQLREKPIKNRTEREWINRKRNLTRTIERTNRPRKEPNQIPIERESKLAVKRYRSHYSSWYKMGHARLASSKRESSSINLWTVKNPDRSKEPDRERINRFRKEANKNPIKRMNWSIKEVNKNPIKRMNWPKVHNREIMNRSRKEPNKNLKSNRKRNPTKSRQRNEREPNANLVKKGKKEILKRRNKIIKKEEFENENKEEVRLNCKQNKLTGKGTSPVWIDT